MSLPEPHLTVPLEVYYFDTDAGGVVHNIAYLRMVEIARSQLAASLGWTLEQMHRTGLVPVVARTEIDYLRPARLGDQLLVTAELAKMEKVRMLMSFIIASADPPETVFIRCVQTMVTVQLPGGRPQRVPQAWRDAYPGLITKN
jgi:YbgC/YbaW family acyl-CoA thioester hydrolase